MNERLDETARGPGQARARTSLVAVAALGFLLVAAILDDRGAHDAVPTAAVAIAIVGIAALIGDLRRGATIAALAVDAVSVIGLAAATALAVWGGRGGVAPDVPERTPSGEPAVSEKGPPAEPGGPELPPPPNFSKPPGEDLGIGKMLDEAAKLIEGGDLEAAESTLSGAFSAATAAGDLPRAAAAALGRAEALLGLKQTPRAIEAIEAFESWERPAGAPKVIEEARLAVVKGETLAGASRPDEARASFDRAIAMTDESFGDDLELRGAAVAGLADLLERDGSVEAAAKAVDAHLEALEERGGEPEDIASWQDRKGRLLGIAGKHDEAVSWFEKSVRTRERAPDPDRRKLGFTRLNLALSLARGGRTDEGRRLFSEARAELDALLPADHPTRSAISQMEAELSEGSP